MGATSFSYFPVVAGEPQGPQELAILVELIPLALTALPPEAEAEAPQEELKE